MMFVTKKYAVSCLVLLANTISTTNAQEIMVNGGTVNLETCENKESQFNITLVYMGTDAVDARYVEAFEWAARRWSKVIVGDLPDLDALDDSDPDADWFGGRFENGKRFTGAVDDVVIGYDIPSTIDGRGGTLGSAGAVFVRRNVNGPSSTISGVMTFDGEDFDAMPDDDVTAIVQHEMGHVLGLVGTTSSLCTGACDNENNQQQSSYICPLAADEYTQIVGTNAIALDLENDGGVGTACGHFEEDSFRTSTSSEVMTGFFEADLFQPLSAVTVAALEDLGYEVDYCGADIFPATEDTIKKFTVYKISKNMTMDEITHQIDPEWVIDEDSGERSKWGQKSAAAAFSVFSTMNKLALATLAAVSALFL